MEYQPELDPVPMRVKYGEIVYDPDYNIYDPAVEGKDLVTTLKPIAEEKEKKFLTAVKDRVKATFMDIYGETKKKKERTYIIDAKEAEERKAKEFDLVKHNKDIA